MKPSFMKSKLPSRQFSLLDVMDSNKELFKCCVMGWLPDGNHLFSYNTKHLFDLTGGKVQYHLQIWRWLPGPEPFFKVASFYLFTSPCELLLTFTLSAHAKLLVVHGTTRNSSTVTSYVSLISLSSFLEERVPSLSSFPPSNYFWSKYEPFSVVSFEYEQFEEFSIDYYKEVFEEVTLATWERRIDGMEKREERKEDESFETKARREVPKDGTAKEECRKEEIPKGTEGEKKDKERQWDNETKKDAKGEEQTIFLCFNQSNQILLAHMAWRDRKLPFLEPKGFWLREEIKPEKIDPLCDSEFDLHFWRFDVEFMLASL
eukprot:TRINITY_DN15303_c0_g1_i1.p1 TRINITY_DN15303_c0_g1~~TRINITY_DN15303_c0_g1_i1.p1  ORF type:complete len:318 (+),score=69.73 TRINITY_DN15303_c0_g1_i1:2-955(+)